VKTIPDPHILNRLPALYRTARIPTSHKIIHLHFHVGACHWYAAEYDGADVFFGFVDLNDPTTAEWAFFSFSELVEAVVEAEFYRPQNTGASSILPRRDEPAEIEWDASWTPTPFREIILPWPSLPEYGETI
jgi:hypothetical protein